MVCLVAFSSESESVVRGRLFSLLYDLQLRCENHPVPTRFWLFGPCARSLLRWVLLGIPEDVLSTDTIKPRQENLKRITKVKQFLRRGGGDLRRACLCLRLTDVVLNITAQKHRARDDTVKKRKQESGGEVDQLPTIVRLGMGEVERATINELTDIVPSICHDPALDVNETLHSLFVTTAHTIMRFAEYAGFPTSLWRLSERFNPVGCSVACERFLEIGKKQAQLLDVGFSYPLYLEAVACKSARDDVNDDSACIEFLTSKESDFFFLNG